MAPGAVTAVDAPLWTSTSRQRDTNRPEVCVAMSRRNLTWITRAHEGRERSR